MLLLDNEGKERVRLEGWPNEYFLTALGSGLGRIAFVHENYRMRSAGTTTRSRASATPIGQPEVMYGRAAARYKATRTILF